MEDEKEKEKKSGSWRRTRRKWRRRKGSWKKITRKRGGRARRRIRRQKQK